MREARDKKRRIRDEAPDDEASRHHFNTLV
jgi:hypothetical protein